ncbi:hypothetical protein CPLU01_12959 [Colletotrichum plurivorum]|uniref:Uncharacterized protein n=1 Tax=Colletotrichum plurivorum TaxID=2175906 RepID=A0A8H6N446_9PEZI|nr:hypothetical protein CPLU01_12959 [Colletotrichum plurivorum]
MSGRISKRKPDSENRKTRERLALALAIESEGVDVMPCSPCFRLNKVCKMSENSNRCSECVRAGLSRCDGSDVRQKRFLKDRGSELIRRGMQSLDELETKDRRLTESESRVLSDLTSVTAS